MSALTYQHVYAPGTPPASAPLLLLHGTGGDEHDLIPLGQEIAPGAALLSPRGDVLEHGHPRFFRRFAEGVFDLADVERRTHALADFIAAAGREYSCDPGKLIAVGFSNGANIAASLLLLRPESLAGAILLRPMVVLQPPTLPNLAGKRVMLSSGAHDPIVPPQDPGRLAAMLGRAGAVVTQLSQPGGHGLTPGDVAAAKRFLGTG